MVHMLLRIAADLQNLTNFRPQRGCDDRDLPYYFKMKCTNCGEVSQKESCVTLKDTVPLPNGRAETNLIQKCKVCSREGTVTLLPGRGYPLTLERSKSGGYATLMRFNWQGLEPVEFSFGAGWKAESTTGTLFEGIDLSGGRYEDFCEEGEFPVRILNLRSNFEVVKRFQYY